MRDIYWNGDERAAAGGSPEKEAFAGQGQGQGQEQSGLSEQGEKTEIIYGENCVRGWLVCTEGILEGEDFRLTGDVSWVGSGEDADVRISAKDSSFGKRQFIIIYDHMHGSFFLIPERGRPLYCNGREVLTAQKLEEGDLIRSGSLSFEFIPFCRSGMSWTE